MQRYALPEPSNIARKFELSAAAALAVTSLILIAVYLTNTELEPHPGNVILTSAGVSAVLAAVFFIHCDLRRHLDTITHEQRYQRMYTMVETAEDIEFGTKPPNVTDIDKHRDR